MSFVLKFEKGSRHDTLRLGNDAVCLISSETILQRLSIEAGLAKKSDFICHENEMMDHSMPFLSCCYHANLDVFAMSKRNLK